MGLTPDMWIALSILAVAILLFVTEWLRVDVVALCVVVALALSGLIGPEEAVSGFSHPVVLTIAALFVVGGGVMQTGLAGAIGRRILALAGTSETRLMTAVMLSVALLSGVMSDTGTVAVLLPAVISLAGGAGLAPSRLLMPLSFGALLGGAMTLIGTPPNIVVSELLAESGQQPFGFFSFSPAGLVLLLVGLGYLLGPGRRLLPDRRERGEPQRLPEPAELLQLYRLPDTLFRLRVRRASPLVGRSLAESALRAEHRVTLLELRRARPRAGAIGSLRRGSAEAPVELIVPDAETRLAAGDLLLVEGESQDVWHAAARLDLGVQAAGPEDEGALIDQEAGVAELLLPPRSALIGQSLAEAAFRQRYQLTVLGIHRPGADAPVDLDRGRLAFGDILLVQGTWERILALRALRRDFVVMGQPEVMIGRRSYRKAPLAALALAGMVLVMATNLLPLVTAALLAALFLVLSGCLSIDQAYEAIDWRSVILIAGMLPLSLALERVELVDLAARSLVAGLGGAGPLAVMAGLFLLTSAFTQVLSNTATAVLIGPIALSAATTIGVRPQAFLMTVAIAASMAFASPVASPVNTLVMAAGGYRFADYLRVGLPLLLLMLLATLLTLPLIFPFG